MSRPLLLGFGIALASLILVEQLKRVPAPASSNTVIQTAVANEPRGVMMLPEDGRGHFTASAMVNGISVQTLVDTGASIVALSQEDAARIGIYPNGNDYRVTLSTANGNIGAAPVKLREVRLGGILVRDVEAVVLPAGKLKQTLLGMSFLRRLSSFQIANGSLVLKE